MKRLIIILCVMLCFLTGCNLSFESLGEKPSKSNYSSNIIQPVNYSSNEELLKAVSPAVVGILAITNNYQSIGTGVCINEKGYILTNNHVIENSNSIRLYLYDGTTTSASLVWTDASLDLAVLKSASNLPYLPMAEDGSYKAGQDVIAIGTPLSLAFKHTATKGMISALNRTIQVDNNFGESTLSNLIQHDASINPGNSGGPLIDLSGRVLGINTVKVADAEGLGFAIPISIGSKVVSQLSANGSYNTAYLGVLGYDAYLRDIDSKNNGVYVVSVDKNSPAGVLGMKKGDIITKVNNNDINSMLDLRLEIYSLNKGDIMKVEYVTDNGKTLTKKVTLEEHPYCYRCEKLNYEDFK